MKRNVFMRSLITFIIALAMCGFSAVTLTAAEEPVVQPRTVKVALMSFSEGINDIAWHQNSETGQLEGYIIDMFREIEKVDETLSFEFETIYQLGAQGITTNPKDEQAAEDGCDLVAGSLLFDAENSDYYTLFTKPWSLYRYYYISDDPNTPDEIFLADLADQEVAVTVSYATLAVQDYNEQNPDHPIQENQIDVNYVVNKINRGDFHSAIVLSSLIYENNADLTNLKIATMPEIDANYFLTGQYMAYNKNDQELADWISADFEKLEEEGILTELSKSYYGADISVPAGEFKEVIGDADAYIAISEKFYADYDSSQDINDFLLGGSSGDSAGGEVVNTGDSAGALVVYTDSATVLAVQQALNEAGFNSGAPDGMKGNMTNQAITQFKAANGMDAGNADITDELLVMLGLK